MSRTKSPVVPFFSNPLLQRFMQESEVRHLFAEAAGGGEGACMELEQRFAEFYYEMRFLGFVRKHIHFEALHVLRRNRARKSQEALLLNSVHGGEDGQGLERIELVPDPRVSVEGEVVGRTIDLGDLTHDPQLHAALQELTEKQRQVLDLLYVKQMTEQEAAAMLGVSQQSINKVKKHCLSRIRRRLSKSGIERRVSL
jgi:RNA polymerase sigma factor (sigma-70 family)